MPQHDPLEQIMTTLRGAKAVDPATAASRKAGLQRQARQTGAPPVQNSRPQGAGIRQAPPTGPVGQQLQQIGSADAAEAATEQSRNMIPVLVDQLNEAIISIKMQVHRERSPETRRVLERQAAGLRQQIQELGGEPIWADETIEEGLTKLRGHGQVGAERINQNLTVGQQQAAAGEPGLLDFLGKRQPVQPVQPGGLQDVMGALAGSATATAAGATAGAAAAPTPTTTPPTTTPPPAVEEPLTGFVDATGRQITVSQAAEMFKDVDLTPEARTSLGLPTERPATTTPPPVEDQQKQQVQQQAQQIVTDVSANFNKLIEQYGLQPRTPEQIQQAAESIVARQVYGRSQVVTRDLERFEREFPAEFAQAQQRIRDEAQTISAEKQEEFASRGMYYSSVMAGVLGKVEEKRIELIGNIARDAANRVSELRSDLRDIAEWGILEQEVVRQQLETQDRALAADLMKLHTEVALRADEMAVTHWYQEATVALQERQLQIEESRNRVSELDRTGQSMAAAFLLDSPAIREYIERVGGTLDQVRQMPIEAQSQLVRSILDIAEWDLKAKQLEANTVALVAQTSLTEAQAKAVPKEVGIKEQLASLQEMDTKSAVRLRDAQAAQATAETAQMPDLLKVKQAESEAQQDLWAAQSALARAQEADVPERRAIEKQLANIEQSYKESQIARIKMEEQLFPVQLQIQKVNAESAAVESATSRLRAETAQQESTFSREQQIWQREFREKELAVQQGELDVRKFIADTNKELAEIEKAMAQEQNTIRRDELGLRKEEVVLTAQKYALENRRLALEEKGLGADRQLKPAELYAATTAELRALYQAAAALDAPGITDAQRRAAQTQIQTTLALLENAWAPELGEQNPDLQEFILSEIQKMRATPQDVSGGLRSYEEYSSVPVIALAQRLWDMVNQTQGEGIPGGISGRSR